MSEKMTKTELIEAIKAQIEEAMGTITDSQIKAIESAVEKKFYEMSKTEGKPVGKVVAEEDSSMQFKSLGENLQVIAKAYMPGGTIDVRLKAAGMNESVPSEGGFLLQPTFAAELVKITHDTAILYGKCRKIPIGPNSNSLVINGIDETSRADGSRWGGVQVYWSDEGGTVTATKPKLRQMTLKPKKLMGVSYVTEELLADATALQAWVTQAFQEEFSFKIDDAIINGTGAGQPLGILNSPALVTQAKETGQAAATVLYENIINMWNRMPARNRIKAEWYINQDVEPQLMQMYLSVGMSGVPAYLPPNGLSAAPYGTLLGRPVVPIEQCAALGTVGDIILADLSEYLIVDKGTMASDVSIHVRFLYDEQTFKFTYRIDGQPLWNNTLTAYKGSTTRSPFVALATRS